MENKALTFMDVREVQHAKDKVKTLASKLLSQGDGGRTASDTYKAAVNTLNSLIELERTMLAEPETHTETVERLNKEMVAK